MSHTLLSPTMLRIDMLRRLRNPATLAFTLGMPVAMYLLFGANSSYASASAGHGNVAFYVMVSMAAYGVAVAMSSITALAATEAQQGWGRQLAMTPLGTTGYALNKVVNALIFASISLGAVFVIGRFTVAQADDAWRWFACAGLILLGGTMFGLYGLGIGLFFISDRGAPALASIPLTFFAFFGNVFIPLDGTMLDIARFTPMYGYASLVRWPLNDGQLTTGQTDQPWAIAANIIGWLAIFGVLVVVGARRSRARW